MLTRTSLSQQGITKDQRRKEARRQRQELLRRAARRRRMRHWGISAFTLVMLAGVVVGIVLASGGSETTTGRALPGMLMTRAPWPANADEMPQRVARLGLPGAGEALHIHSRLELSVHGQKVPVPAEIGITSNLTSPLHTHDATGVIHVESEERRTFTLGEFFDVWGVPLSQSCLGSYCNGNLGALRVFVNGDAFAGSIRALPLRNQAVIVVTFGKQSELPKPIPSQFSFGV